MEQRRAASYLDRAIATPNLFLFLIVLMGFIMPTNCAEHETRTNNVDIKMLLRAGEDNMEKGTPLIDLKPCQCLCQCPDCSGPSSALSQLRMETDWMKDSGLAVKITSELANPIPAFQEQLEETAGQQMLEYWVKHSESGLVEEIANTLAMKREDVSVGTIKEIVTSLKPPPPSSGTVQGYNPWLDEPRPTEIEDYLRVFEVMFIVDDSWSMTKEQRWPEARDALATIAQYAFDLNVNSVSLRFLNNLEYVRGLKGKEKVTTLFDTVQPRSRTPLGRALKAVFEEHLDRVDTAVRMGKEEYSKIPPLDIIVLTDGVPTDKGEDEPKNVIATAVERLNESHYHPNTMGVQIVQIANAEKAKKVLKDLVIGDNGRIVDTVPYGGVVDDQKLLRIILGGVHPNIRSELPDVMLAN